MSLRHLAAVQADIIADLYGHNLEIDSSIEVPKLVERLMLLEHKLTSLKKALPPGLQRRPWLSKSEAPHQQPSPDLEADRLSVIMTLRYLHTRIFLYRPILTTILRQEAIVWSQGLAHSESEGFVQEIGQRSTRVCEASAIEIIRIVGKLSNPWSSSGAEGPTLLGAWWFSTYYGK